MAAQFHLPTLVAAVNTVGEQCTVPTVAAGVQLQGIANTLTNIQQTLTQMDTRLTQAEAQAQVNHTDILAAITAQSDIEHMRRTNTMRVSTNLNAVLYNEQFQLDAWPVNGANVEATKRQVLDRLEAVLLFWTCKRLPSPLSKPTLACRTETASELVSDARTF